MKRQSSIATRARLVAAAEALFAERGIDSVSLSEITKAAGQRNASALHYHFGGKDALVDAILEKHQPGIARRRHEMIDDMEASGDVELHGLLAALVFPLADKLDDPDGGAHYVSLMAQLLSKPGANVLQMGAHNAASGRDRLMRLVAAACPAIPEPVLRLRAIAVSGLLFHALADFDRLSHAGEEATANSAESELFAYNLRDCLTAMLTAPVAPDTAALVREEVVSEEHGANR
jgi:AcrR family transcriptional regulator